MKCALCKKNGADKKNTHFLTDAIIRTCLNEDGENIREKGFYFDVSNDSPFVEFNFQRRTTVEKLVSTLGREPNEDEIEKAKTIPFSVDYIFCSACEKKFTEIEDRFIQKYLDKFRSKEYNERAIINDYKAAKSFFLLQVWRTSICDEIFHIPENTAEKLRLLILNNNEATREQLSEFPLAVSFLITENGDNPAANFVGYTDDTEPNLIIMNDFIIQFFSSQKSVYFFDFYGLNDKDTYREMLNTSPDKFVIQIVSDEQRQKLLIDFITTDKVKSLKKFYADNFGKLWNALFGNYPSPYLTHKYLMYLTNGSENNLLHYTKDNIFDKTRQFIENQLK